MCIIHFDTPGCMVYVCRLSICMVDNHWLYCDVDGTLGCVLCTLEKPDNNSSIFQNQPDQLETKSQVMIETQATRMSKNSIRINQGMAESHSATTVQERVKQPVKREFMREVNNNHVESEELDIDLKHSSDAETREFIDSLLDKNRRLLSQNTMKDEKNEKLEARLKKLRNKLERKDQSILTMEQSIKTKEQIILNMSIAAKSKNES